MFRKPKNNIDKTVRTSKHYHGYWFDLAIHNQLTKEFIEKVLVKLNDPTSKCDPHIEKYIEEIHHDIVEGIEINNYSQSYKKNIMKILQEKKIKLSSEFENELLTIILKET
jgi:hypothetical protein